MGEADEEDRHNTAVSVADVESGVGDEYLAKEEVEGLDSFRRVRLHIHSKRKRLCDADGISGKAAIDGLVHAGILPDDSPKYVESVSYSQEKAKEEETIITITEI